MSRKRRKPDDINPNSWMDTYADTITLLLTFFILLYSFSTTDNEKLKLNNLFKELELRGMYFDRDSKEKIVQLYEKLSLLEKKSDSGDAQYVRSIL